MVGGAENVWYSVAQENTCAIRAGEWAVGRRSGHCMKEGIGCDWLLKMSPMTHLSRMCRVACGVRYGVRFIGGSRLAQAVSC